MLTKRFLCIEMVFMIVFFWCVSAQAQDSIFSKKDTVIVALAGAQPFVMTEEGSNQREGIAVDIWNDLADRLSVNFKYQKFSSVGEALKAVENGKADLLVGPVSITSNRMERVSFSQPFYQSSLSILSRSEEGLWDYIAPLFSYKFFIAVGGFLFLLAIVGTLFWVAERKKNPEEFPANPARGIGNGMWLAVVTMSTVGYGDLAPRTAFGRILAGSWIIITIIFATSMIAGIASVLTMWGGSTAANTIEDLSGKRVAVLADSPGQELMKDYTSRPFLINSMSDGVEKLKEEEVTALLYDRPELEYFVNKQKGEGYHLANAEYERQNYGFAFPLKSAAVYRTNLELLKLAEEGRIQEIVDSYLKSNKEESNL